MSDRHTNDFFSSYEDTLIRYFDDPHHVENLRLNREIPYTLIRKALACQPLSLFIPKKYGGQENGVSKSLKMLDITSYYALPLSLMMGINGALFIQPVSIYADPSVAKKVFNDVINRYSVGGLMITEPDYGSDALHMQTSFEENDTGYRIKGVKHWGGLTGMADYWLITAREKKLNGGLGRDIGFFLHDNNNQGIHVTTLYHNAGLVMLPYGKNDIDAHIPKKYKLIPRSTGISMMLDTLHRSRLQFPGMATGFLRRLLDESLDHAKKRMVGRKALIDYDQVKKRISKIQTNFVVSSAMCLYASKNAGIEKDISSMDIPANCIKSIVTDMMQESAQSYLQLCGANGYRMDHLAASAVLDSRPFQIFEGSNDILYQQISESVFKEMKKKNSKTLWNYFLSNSFTKHVPSRLKLYTDSEWHGTTDQSKQVLFGKVIGLSACMSMVQEYGTHVFSDKMTNSALDDLMQEVVSLISVSELSSQNRYINPEFQSAEADWFS